MTVEDVMTRSFRKMAQSSLSCNSLTTFKAASSVNILRNYKEFM